MKILYKQKTGHTFFDQADIFECCLKKLNLKKDRANIKEHSHTDYEIHIVTKGSQVYEVGGEAFHICAGEFLLIPPKLRHRSLRFDENMEKFALTFRKESEISLFCNHGKLPREVIECIKFITEEHGRQKMLSDSLIAGRIFELLILLMRRCGMKEDEASGGDSEFDERIILAKKYIKDNIEKKLTVGELADYCYIGKKQLTRIFIASEGRAPLEYINKIRAEHISRLLKNTNLSVGEISRRMDFSSEYYFNTFFKKYYGMPPGEYRKMYAGEGTFSLNL